MSFKEKIGRFFQGRYMGNDAFNRFLTVLTVGFLLLSTIFSLCDMRKTALVLSFAEFFCLFYWFFRIFSKNIQKRQRENQKYLGVKGKIKGFFSLRHAMWKYRKISVFRRCPGCGAMLRLPKKKGTHTVKCQCCSKRFEVIIK